jgi:hypothetical protein
MVNVSDDGDIAQVFDGHGYGAWASRKTAAQVSEGVNRLIIRGYVTACLIKVRKPMSVSIRRRPGDDEVATLCLLTDGGLFTNVMAKWDGYWVCGLPVSMLPG